MKIQIKMSTVEEAFQGWKRCMKAESMIYFMPPIYINSSCKKEYRKYMDALKQTIYKEEKKTI